MPKFKTLYELPEPVTCELDTETTFVDQSEADRVSLKFQLERYGMDSLLHQFEKTKAQFGYADTRLSSNFVELQNKVAEANSYFMQLPSKIRAQFNHSSTQFFTMLEENPEKAYNEGYISKDLATKLGVVKTDVVKTEIPKETVKVETVEKVETITEKPTA